MPPALDEVEDDLGSLSASCEADGLDGAALRSLGRGSPALGCRPQLDRVHHRRLRRLVPGLSADTARERDVFVGHPVEVDFTNAQGVGHFGRYRIVPEAGNSYLDEAALKQKSPNYLFDEIAERIGNRPVAFKLLAQLAKDGDVVDDATVHWPEDREL